MASIGGVTGNNSASIYGNRNVLSGLATGMDTESMIQNAVSGYQKKVSSLIDQQTKLSWKQESYRSVSSPLVEFSRKYMSYTSSNNLLSASFFNKAVTTTTGGKYSSSVGATGKTNSDIEILGVKQLATKAVHDAFIKQQTGAGGGPAAVGLDKIDLSGDQTLSTVSGILTLKYGGDRSIDVNFDEKDVYKNAQEITDAINKKLSETKLADSSGNMVTADKMVKAVMNGDKIEFQDVAGAGNKVTIEGAYGDIKDTLKIDTSNEVTSIDMTGITEDDLKKVEAKGDLLKDKSISITVDGKTKSIKLPDYVSTGDADADTRTFVEGINKNIQKAFGTSVRAGLTADGRLEVEGAKGSSVSISTTETVGNLLGLEGGRSTSYLDTSKTLAVLMGIVPATDTTPETMRGIPGVLLKADGKVTKQEDGSFLDSKGNVVDDLGNRLGKDGEKLYGYNLTINGKDLTFNRDTTMENVMTGINADPDIGVNVTFSATTNSFQFTSRETGSAGHVEIKAKTKNADGVEVDNLAAKIFNTADKTGEDAILTMKVNGTVYENATRTDNSFAVDGLSITLKDKFGYDAAGVLEPGTEPVTFTTKSDSDKIVTALTDMVKDLNAMLKATHDAFATLPSKKSDKSSYEPLSEEDKATMSESAIKEYEEKAKKGNLFGDGDLSRLYDKLLSAITPTGTNATSLEKMGIKATYTEGVTSLEIDEEKLRDALTNNPNSVRDAFTSTDGTGGMMVKLDNTIKEYAATNGATKGLLIEKAGSPYAALSLMKNELLSQIDELDKQVDRWQSKLSDKVDYYTRQFTQLEMLTSNMNSQSSMITGMLGG